MLKSVLLLIFVIVLVTVFVTVFASVSVHVFVSVDQVEEFLQLTTNIAPLYSYLWLTAKALACCNLSLEISVGIFLSHGEIE